jgi:hypothetical protein
MMKMRIMAVTAMVLAAGLFAGCMTSKTTTVTPGGTTAGGVVFGPVTNTVTTVNEANLALDCGVLQGLVAAGVSIVVQKEPGSIPALKDAELALDGILNGANTNTTAQALALLGSNSNPVLASEITSLMQVGSALEQKLLAKYGQSVTGEISLALTKAVYGGLVIGLAGQ